MYPWERIEPETDSTVRLIHEAVARNHTVVVTSPNNLTIRESTTSAFCKVIKKIPRISTNIPTFYRKVEFKKAQLGMPGNTYTQEGLAILSEYLSGNLSLERLRTLALRVLAANMLVKKYSNVLMGFAWLYPSLYLLRFVN